MSVFDYVVRDISGSERSLAEYRGKVLLIVNVASRCGFTPQYTGLEALYRKYRERGLIVLGFPCNQFGAQEPGTEEQIKNFCSTTYDVSFPLFSKVDVNGADAHPLYRYLKAERPGILGTGAIKWNFTKFLVNRERFAPNAAPESLETRILALL
jgi:glutathione peroxidase